MFGRRKSQETPAAAAARETAAPATTLPPRRVTDARVEAALDALARRRSGLPASPAGPQGSGDPVGYQALSRWYAAGGRMDHATLALWAHDLRALRPHLVAGDPAALLAQVDADAGDDPYGTLDRVRVRALDALFAAGVRTAELPELASATHISDVAGTDRPQVTGLGNHDDLRATADHLMRRAQIAPDGPDVARRDARRADLAALDSLLVASAHRAGDISGVTIELRRSLAAKVLAPLEARLRNMSLLEEVRAVRVALRGVVEPHEVAGLNRAFPPEPV